MKYTIQRKRFLARILVSPPHHGDPIVKSAREQLLRTSGVFRLLVESVRDYAIFVLDCQGNVITWNKGAQAIKGYTRQEILGQHFS